MTEFINEITQVSPNDLITDETTNLINNELQNNIKYLVNILASKTTSSVSNQSSTTNLLNFDSNGNTVSQNGGTFNTFEAKNSWTAVKNNAVVNDVYISNAVSNLLIYNGEASTIESAALDNSWLERQFFIPTTLQGGQLIFGLKGTGLNTVPISDAQLAAGYDYCNASTTPGVYTVANNSTCIARYEDIIIQITGSVDPVTATVTLGPWPQFNQYATADWNPAYRSVYVTFNVGVNTSSIKIKVIRTKTDGAIGLSQMVLFGLPEPIPSYNFKNVDINELYDFTNNVLKINATTVNGKHSAQSGENSKLAELITKEQFLYLLQYNKDIFFDWDQISGPRLVEMDNSIDAPPKINIFEFNPNSTNYLHFNVKSNGPTPGMCCLSFAYGANQNEFSNAISCPTSAAFSPTIVYPLLNCASTDDSCVYFKTNMHTYPDPNLYCKNVKFDVFYKTINPGDPISPNFSTFNKISFLIAIPKYMLDGSSMGNFEIYYDFFKNIKNIRGAITYFTISRDGSNILDTFDGNFLLGPTSLNIANPPDDIPHIGSYTIKPSNC